MKVKDLRENSQQFTNLVNLAKQTGYDKTPQYKNAVAQWKKNLVTGDPNNNGGTKYKKYYTAEKDKLNRLSQKQDKNKIETQGSDEGNSTNTNSVNDSGAIYKVGDNEYSTGVLSDQGGKFEKTPNDIVIKDVDDAQRAFRDVYKKYKKFGKPGKNEEIIQGLSDAVVQGVNAATNSLDAKNKAGNNLRDRFGKDFMVKFINAFKWEMLRNKTNQMTQFIGNAYGRNYDSIGKSLSLRDFQTIYNAYVRDADLSNLKTMNDIQQFVNANPDNSTKYKNKAQKIIQDFNSLDNSYQQQVFNTLKNNNGNNNQKI